MVEACHCDSQAVLEEKVPHLGRGAHSQGKQQGHGQPLSDVYNQVVCCTVYHTPHTETPACWGHGSAGGSLGGLAVGTSSTRGNSTGSSAEGYWP